MTSRFPIIRVIALVILSLLAAASLTLGLVGPSIAPALVTPWPATSADSTDGSTGGTASAGPGSGPESAAAPLPTPAPSPTAPAASAAEVQAAVAPALAEAPGAVAAEVRDVATGEVLYARDADTVVAPASAVKILTAATAVRVLGAERTLPTRVVALPSEGGVTELVLVGGGDSLLGTGASDPTRLDGRAGLKTLAERTAAGLEEAGVTGPVTVSLDLRLVADSGVNPAWSTALMEGGHISRVQPLATFGGRAEPGTAEERVPDPAQFAARTFQSRLATAVEEAGADLEVDVRETVPDARVSRADVLAAEPVGQVESAPVGAQVGYMLAHSENQVAEVLARVAAAESGRPATGDGAASLLEEEAGELGVDAAGLDLVDASGLAPSNRMSAGQLAQLVVALHRDPALEPVLDGLPEPGEDSTLAERFAGTAAADAVSAKTGTLDGIVSLTGTVRTAQGRELAFSMIASDLEWHLDAGRAAIDAAVTALAEL